MPPSATQRGSFLDTALEFLSHAIGAEDSHDYTEAYAKYMAALDYLMAAEQSETNEKSRLFLKEKADEYLNRAEAIRQHVHMDAAPMGPWAGGPGMPASRTRTAQSIVLDEAFRCAKEAIDADVSQDYAGAYKQYVKSLDYFMFAQRYELNEQSKALILSEINEYLSRAETIKKHLDSLKQLGAPNKIGLSERSPRSPEVVFLHIAAEIAERAMQQDVQKNYRSAYELYNGALDYFMLAQKYEKNEQSRTAIRATMEEHLARAEALKKCTS